MHGQKNIKLYINKLQNVLPVGWPYYRLLILKFVNTFQKRNTEYACKAILVQAWTSPEGSRRLRLPDFKTMGT